VKENLNSINAAIECLAVVKEFLREKSTFNVRIGINSGYLVGALIGLKVARYDIFGEALSIAKSVNLECGAN